MKRFNQELLAKIYGLCERDGAIKNVGAEYYSDFLNIPERGMETLIACIINDRVDTINKKIFSGEWQSDGEIYEYVTDFLEMIAQGIVGISSEGSKLMFSKPVGEPPDAETEQKIDKKIQDSIALIKKIIMKSYES